MKTHLLLLALLAGSACSSSSTPGTNGSDASSAGDTSSAGDDASAGDASTGDDGSAPDTWANWGQGFFTKYCVECHSVNDPAGLDFGVQAKVVANKNNIRCGVGVTQDSTWSCPSTIAAKQFPISDPAGTNPKPSDAERTRVVAWIAAGCP